MKRAFLALFLVAALVSPAAADSRSGWQGVFVGSSALTMFGGALFWYGTGQVDHAEQQLCTDSYAGANCDFTPPTSQARVDALNDKGEHGQTLARVGGGMIVGGAILMSISAYKGFVAKDTDLEPAVAVAPVVTGDGAGAIVRFRF